MCTCGVCLLHPLHPEVAWRPLASMQLKCSSLAEGTQQCSLTGVSTLNHNGILLQGLLNLAANMYKAAKAYPGSYSVRIRGSVCTTQVRRRSLAHISIPLVPATGWAGTVQRARSPRCRHPCAPCQCSC
jgi:hypothetical protein